MINNRQQNGRRRGRGGGGNGGGGQRNGNPGRPDTGNRIDSRARGNANQLYEKYRNLARDAQMSGDRVNTEYYLQFADHYFRVLSESRSRSDDQSQQPRRQSNDAFDAFDGDDDYGDEGEPIRAGEQAGDDRGNRFEQRDGRDQRDVRPPQGEPREPREAREQNGRGDREPRRNANGNAGNGAGNGAPMRESEDRPARVATPVANDVGDESSPEVAEAVPAESRRPRRARRDRVVAVDEGEAPAAIEADRLPPSLGAASEAAEPAAEPAEDPKPRRRRLRTVNGGDATPAG